MVVDCAGGDGFRDGGAGDSQDWGKNQLKLKLNFLYYIKTGDVV
jgi:hypothetical protein